MQSLDNNLNKTLIKVLDTNFYWCLFYNHYFIIYFVHRDKINWKVRSLLFMNNIIFIQWSYHWNKRQRNILLRKIAFWYDDQSDVNFQTISQANTMLGSLCLNILISRFSPRFSSTSYYVAAPSVLRQYFCLFLFIKYRKARYWNQLFRAMQIT